MAYPEWVEKHRRKGTNISCIRGKYYLYACTSKYDPVKKRARKITGEYLGRITEDGLIPPKKKKTIDSVTVKEFGASNAAVEHGTALTAGRAMVKPFAIVQIHLLSAAERA